MFVRIRQGGLKSLQAIELSFAGRSQIKARLCKGESLSDILCRGRKEAYFQNLHQLSNVFDLPKAVQICSNLEKGSADLYRQLLKESVYPLFLMAAAWAVNTFFIQMVLPSLSVYGDSDFGLIYLLQNGLNLVWLLLLGLTLLWFWVYWLHLPAFRLKGWFESVGVVARIHTSQLSLLMEELQKNGMNTKDSLQVIAALKKQPFCSRTARQWHRQMKKGISLEECIRRQSSLDPAWIPFFLCGLESGQMGTLLEGYRKQTQASLIKSFKKGALYIQLFSYSTIGVLVLTVYQGMLSPLNMLNSF